MSESTPVKDVTFDEKIWNKERNQNSSINRAEEYYSGVIKETYKKYGVEGCTCNDDQMREMAYKYVPRALKTFNIVGNDCRTVAAYFKLVDKIVFETDFEIVEDTPRRVVMRGSSGCPLSRNPQEELCRDICDNGQGHELVAVQIINPEIKFYNLKLMSAGDDSCTMAFELPEPAPLGEVSVPVSLYKVDETVWPLERRKKARRLRTWENYGSMLRALYKKYGADGVKIAYEVTYDNANKYVYMALKNHNLKGNDARTVGGYYKIFHKLIFDNDLEIVEDTPQKVVMRNTGFCPLAQNPAEELDPEICRNAMGHEDKACEVINPDLKFSLSALRSDGKPYCEYVFEL